MRKSTIFATLSLLILYKLDVHNSFISKKNSEIFHHTQLKKKNPDNLLQI